MHAMDLKPVLINFVSISFFQSVEAALATLATREFHCFFYCFFTLNILTQHSLQKDERISLLDIKWKYNSD